VKVHFIRHAWCRLGVYDQSLEADFVPRVIGDGELPYGADDGEPKTTLASRPRTPVDVVSGNGFGD
jgi:hypothetical protein